MTLIQNLKIALIQTDLYWKDKVANLSMLEEKLFHLKGQADLIVLPELFPTGFTMDTAEVAEPMNTTVTKWMKQLAAQTAAVITGSVIIKENNNFYNRKLWVYPNGDVQYYDKRHLFRMANEEKHFSMGDKRLVVEVNGWRILSQVCYDLRFPVWSRNRSENGLMEYDLMVYVASWPSARVIAWDMLLKARAIENLSYSVGVNRIGTDGNGINYSGHSGAYSFKGETIEFCEENDAICLVELDYKQLLEYRKKFPAWEDADPFSLH
jgi:omega-amidase